MIAKKYYCNSREGTIEVKFSKAELGRTGVMAECDYTCIANNNYNVKINLGVDGYELFSEYKEIYLICKSSELKDQLINWFKKQLKEDAVNNMKNFIDNVVRPIYVRSSEEVGKIYEVVDIENKRFHVEVYTDKTDYYLESDNGLERKKVFTVNKNQSLSEINRCISDKEYEKEA